MERNDTEDFRFSKSERSSRPNGATRIIFCPTTGGSFDLTVHPHETIQGLKNLLSRKLRIPQAKIYLLFRERLLKHGTLRENNITEDSRITLLPTMESGFAFPHEDSGVMQALESLSDSQVNNFLSGRAPLVLAMRLGDHMMFIQLQLSTSQCGGRRSRPSPVMVPSPGQISVQDHQEIPSPTLGEASGGHHQINHSHMSKNLHNFTHFSQPTADKHTGKQGMSNILTPGTNSTQHQFFSSHTPTSQVATTPSSGAVIESMHHLGGGVYSGKFSGTLDPNLHDFSGHPRRDISTIIHILNDLLGASPQYRQYCISLKQKYNSTSHSSLYGNKSQETESNKMSEDDPQLRQKVRQLQRMMEERKNNRRARRTARGPYQWSDRHHRYDVIGEDDDKQQSNVSQDKSVMDVTEGMDLSAPTAGYHGNSIKQTDTLAV